MPDRELDAVLDAAAKLLSASAFPVIAGLEADIAGVAAAMRLAERLGGAVDHTRSEPALREAAVLHDVGMMLVSPGEARRRADTFLIVGDRPLAAWPDLPQFLFPKGRPLLSDRIPTRRILSVSAREPVLPDGDEAAWLACTTEGVPGLIGALRARASGRPIAAGADRSGIEGFVEILKAARFGVAIWSPDELDALSIEMLTGLVKDLNAETRWSCISAADISAAGAAIACGWLTGFPLRVGFGRGVPEHDPWRFDAERLVRSGEADAIVWVSAFGNPPPAWIGDIPSILVSDAKVAPAQGSVSIQVARPGRDHEAVLYDRRTGTLVRAPASRAPQESHQAPPHAPPVAEALNGILARLGPP